MYTVLVVVEFGLALATVVGLRFVVAPYGRHHRTGWGPTMPARLGWVVMESPSVLWFAAVYAAGPHAATLVPLVLLGLWQLHYLQRTVVFPALMRPGGRMPLVVAAMAFTFNLLNAFVNAHWIAALGRYPTAWLTDPRFLVGAALFLGGFGVNLWADRSLRRLRPPGESGYRIPRGGLYRFVSCPNYLGEIVEWFGWALATWSPAGLAFAVHTTANLAPRAVQHHQWYLDRFPDYPRDRRALVPYLV